MAQQITNIGKDLNNTFLPTSLLRTNPNKLATSLPSKHQFQKTTGNAFIVIEPPEIKFAGYDLDKLYTATVKIINRAPISQRVTFISPQNGAFSIKHNKKGSIASGMADTITVLFRSNQYKYQTDVISIRTETDNFVIPLYAYPTLPQLKNIFPKVIDFGTVELKEPTTYFYPINNPVPLNFEFEFLYQKECPQISINPLKGVIPAEQTLTVQITFTPISKCTSIAEVILQVQQFDFQPLPIRILGSGVQSANLPQQKRIKSSKLAPLKEGEESKKIAQPLLKRRPSAELLNNTDTNNQMLGTGTINTGNLIASTLKKSNIRTSYPKLGVAKKTMGEEEDNRALSPRKVAERQYLNRFGKIQDLDKEKDIKFAQFQGDKAMTEEEIEFQRSLVEQIQKVRLQVLEKKCVQRYNPQLCSDVAVQFKTVPPKTVTWDDKQNDQLHSRRRALLRFMNTASKVILKYRLLKRLGKIKELLANCKSKQEVRRLVEESHTKAMDRHQGLSSTEDLIFDFGLDSIRPSYFELQFQQSQQKQSNILFKPEGKARFDDLTEAKQIIPHNRDAFKLAEQPFPPEYFNHNSFIPPPRLSAEEELFLKTSALNSYQPESLTSAYSLPLKIPAHHFIYDQHFIRRYQNYVSSDEKDPEVYLQNDQPIEDEFEGWTGGQMDVLKSKFNRNLGCPYITFSGFNYSSESNPLPPLATLGQNLPRLIDQPTYEDTIHKGDSDEEDLHEAPVESALKFLDQIQGNNADLKDRRSKKETRNPQKMLVELIEKNVDNIKLKALGDFIGRVRQTNKWTEHNQNRFLL